MSETSVDLPEPVGPTMASEEPAGMVEGDVVEDFGAGGVGEVEMVEGDVAGEGDRG